VRTAPDPGPVTPDRTVRPQYVDANGHPLQANGRAAVSPDLAAGAAITRSEILARAQTWLNPPVPYSQSAYKGGYRTDCSGYVSMAWHLPENGWTSNLNQVGVAIGYNDLRPGDMLLYHNPADPTNGSHVVLFDHWAGGVGGDFYIYEQTVPNAKHRLWSQAGYSRSNPANFPPSATSTATAKPTSPCSTSATAPCRTPPDGTGWHAFPVTSGVCPEGRE
jgi:hypothetical protein